MGIQYHDIASVIFGGILIHRDKRSTQCGPSSEGGHYGVGTNQISLK